MTPEETSKLSVNYCKNCGGFVEYDAKHKLASCPPKYQGTCRDCGNVVYEDCLNVLIAKGE